MLKRLTMARTGRWVAIRGTREVELVDLLGTEVNRALPPVKGAVAFVGKELWGLDGPALYRLSPEELRSLTPTALVQGGPTGVVPGYGPTAVDAVVLATPPCRVSLRGESLVVEPLKELDAAETIVAVHEHRIVVARPGRLRAIDRGRGEAWRTDGLLDEVHA